MDLQKKKKPSVGLRWIHFLNSFKIKLIHQFDLFARESTYFITVAAACENRLSWRCEIAVGLAGVCRVS